MKEYTDFEILQVPLAESWLYCKPNDELREAMEDVRLNRNLSELFTTAEEAVRSMLED